MVNTCDHCERPMSYEAVLCDKCANSSRLRAEYGIRTSADYGLGDDYVINALCFLHACGVLDSFIDSIEYWNNSTSGFTLRIEDMFPELILSQYENGFVRESRRYSNAWYPRYKRKD